MPRLDVPVVRVNLGSIPTLEDFFEKAAITIKASDLPVRERDLIPTKNWRERAGCKPGGELRGKFYNLTARWTEASSRPALYVTVYGDATRTHMLGHFYIHANNFIQVGTSANTFLARVPARDGSTSYYLNPVPYRDDDGTGTFHFDISLFSNVDIDSDKLELELEYVPEYPV